MELLRRQKRYRSKRPCRNQQTRKYNETPKPFGQSTFIEVKNSDNFEINSTTYLYPDVTEIKMKQPCFVGVDTVKEIAIAIDRANRA